MPGQALLKATLLKETYVPLVDLNGPEKNHDVVRVLPSRLSLMERRFLDQIAPKVFPVREQFNELRQAGRLQKAGFQVQDVIQVYERLLATSATKSKGFSTIAPAHEHFKFSPVELHQLVFTPKQNADDVNFDRSAQPAPKSPSKFSPEDTLKNYRNAIFENVIVQLEEKWQESSVDDTEQTSGFQDAESTQRELGHTPLRTEGTDEERCAQEEDHDMSTSARLSKVSSGSRAAISTASTPTTGSRAGSPTIGSPDTKLVESVAASVIWPTVDDNGGKANVTKQSGETANGELLCESSNTFLSFRAYESRNSLRNLLDSPDPVIGPNGSQLFPQAFVSPRNSIDEDDEVKGERSLMSILKRTRLVSDVLGHATQKNGNHTDGRDQQFTDGEKSGSGRARVGTRQVSPSRLSPSNSSTNSHGESPKFSKTSGKIQSMKERTVLPGAKQDFSDGRRVIVENSSATFHDDSQYRSYGSPTRRSSPSFLKSLSMKESEEADQDFNSSRRAGVRNNTQYSPGRASPTFLRYSPTRSQGDSQHRSPGRASSSFLRNSPTRSQGDSQHRSPGRASPTFSRNSPTRSQGDNQHHSPGRDSPTFSRNSPTRSQGDNQHHSPGRDSPTFSRNSPTRSQGDNQHHSPGRASPTTLRNSPARSHGDIQHRSPARASPTFLRSLSMNESTVFAAQAKRDFSSRIAGPGVLSSSNKSQGGSQLRPLERISKFFARSQSMKERTVSTAVKQDFSATSAAGSHGSLERSAKPSSASEPIETIQGILGRSSSRTIRLQQVLDSAPGEKPQQSTPIEENDAGPTVMRSPNRPRLRTLIDDARDREVEREFEKEREIEELFLKSSADCGISGTLRRMVGYRKGRFKIKMVSSSRRDGIALINKSTQVGTRTTMDSPKRSVAKRGTTIKRKTGRSPRSSPKRTMMSPKRKADRGRHTRKTVKPVAPKAVDETKHRRSPNRSLSNEFSLPTEASANKNHSVGWILGGRPGSEVAIATAATLALNSDGFTDMDCSAGRNNTGMEQLHPALGHRQMRSRSNSSRFQREHVARQEVMVQSQIVVA